MANMHLVTGYAGEPHVTAVDFGAFWAAIIGSGDYVLDHGQKFAATIVSNNLIRIADGELLMQGRHGRIYKGTTVDLTIENGIEGNLRKDLIVARYTKSAETGIEEINLAVIVGTAVESSPADPEYISGNILNGDLQRDFPLFRINFNGVTMSSIDTLFTVIPSLTTNNEQLSKIVFDKMNAIEELANTVANIKVGSYTGTGKDNKMTIACGFSPKYIFICSPNVTDFEYLQYRGFRSFLKTITATIEYESSFNHDEMERTETLTNAIDVVLNADSVEWTNTMPRELSYRSGYSVYTGTVPTATIAEANYNKSNVTYYYMILG